MVKEMITPGKTIMVDGRKYFRVRMQCPVCLERGLNPEMKNWTHGECGGDLYVGGNAYYFCWNCEDFGHVTEYGYSCPVHNAGEQKEYVRVENLKYIGCAVATAAQAMAGIPGDEAGLEFLEEFIINLRKQTNK